MTYAPTLAAVLLVAVHYASPVRADAVISGPGCVVDGNTVQVGGKVRKKKCWGGIDVRLYGSTAPELNERCTDTDGTLWDCGLKARDVLARTILQHSITCYHLDGEFMDAMPVVTCISGRLDLAQEIVRQGMAKAGKDSPRRYEREERDAKQGKRGLWK